MKTHSAETLLSIWLDPSDLAQYRQLLEFLHTVPPRLDAPERNAYVKQNLLLQEWTSFIKFQLNYALSQLKSDLYNLASQLQDELKAEKIKSAEERNRALHGDPRYRRQALEVEQLGLVVTRINDLEWILKGAVK